MNELEAQLKAVKILTLGLVRGSVWAVGRFVVCENVYSRSSLYGQKSAKMLSSFYK